jgi:hypothetical protein
LANRTSADLVLEVLDRLGVLAAGQTPGIEDTAKVQAKLGSIVELYAGEEVVFISDIENIPNAFFLPFADLCAFECLGSFGVSGDDADKITEKKTAAVGALKIINRGRPTYETLKTEFC